MADLIKAQLYQLKKGRILFVFCALMSVQAALMLGEFNENASLTVSEYLAESMFMMVCTAFVFAAAAAGEICCADFNDRTANYEIMAGHTRREIYLSRVVLSLITGTVGTHILMALPIITGSCIWGFGTALSTGKVALRLALLIFPAMRFTAEFVFIGYIIKNSYITTAIGFFYAFYGGMLIDIWGKPRSVLLSIINALRISYFDFYQTYSAIDLKNYYVYESGISCGLVLQTITASIIFGGVFLYLGYLFFKKDDMR